MLSPSVSVQRLPPKHLQNQLRVTSTLTRFRHASPNNGSQTRSYLINGFVAR